MKKIFMLCGILILLSGCERNYSISFQNQNDCNKPQLLLTKNEKNIYTYCLEKLKVKINKKEIELKNYIEDNDGAIDKIIKTLELEDILDDGGTQIYKGDITLIKCNTLDGNKDIYIGSKDLKFKQNFCKNNNYTFTRTYTVKDISEYTEQQYTDDGIPVGYGNSFKVTLSKFQGDTKTVIINNLWDITLKKNNTYEFEFMLYDDAVDIKDDIEYIFKNSTIVEIRKTNKIGLEQIQEPINNKSENHNEEDNMINTSDNNINITINGKNYNAILEDNETAQTFKKLLPKDFNMSELNGNEKYIYMDNSLPTNSSNPKYIKSGDIMLYGDNCLVIFYKSFNTSYSYTRIGHIDNLSDLGNSSVTVKFEK